MSGPVDFAAAVRMRRQKLEDDLPQCVACSMREAVPGWAGAL